MTTAELLDLPTPYGPLGDCMSVYRGPCRDRLTLRDAAAAGVLVFSVNRPHVHVPVGHRTSEGYFAEFGEAESVLAERGGAPYRICAHHKGFGYDDECCLSFILSSARCFAR